MKQLLLTILLATSTLSSCSQPTLIKWKQKCSACGHELDDQKYHQPAKVGEHLEIVCITRYIQKSHQVTVTEWVPIP